MKELLNKYLRVIKFGAVGCINTVVDFLVFMAASELFAMSPVAAQSFGYFSGVACSYVLNHLVTFSDAKKESAAGEASRLVRFVLVNLASWGVSALLMHIFTEMGMWKYLAKVFVIFVPMVINYFGYKILVFKIKGD